MVAIDAARRSGGSAEPAAAQPTVARNSRREPGGNASLMSWLLGHHLKPVRRAAACRAKHDTSADVFSRRAWGSDAKALIAVIGTCGAGAVKQAGRGHLRRGLKGKPVPGGRWVGSRWHGSRTGDTRGEWGPLSLCSGSKTPTAPRSVRPAFSWSGRPHQPDNLSRTGTPMISLKPLRSILVACLTGSTTLLAAGPASVMIDVQDHGEWRTARQTTPRPFRRPSTQPARQAEASCVRRAATISSRGG